METFKALSFSQKMAFGFVVLFLLLSPIIILNSGNKNTTRTRAAEVATATSTAPFLDAVRFKKLDTDNSYAETTSMKNISTFYSFTMETWFNMPKNVVTPSGEYTIANFRPRGVNSSAPFEMKLSIVYDQTTNISKPKFSMAKDIYASQSTTVGEIIPTAITNGTWAHVAVTGYVSNGYCQLRFYVDGLLRETAGAPEYTCNVSISNTSSLQIANKTRVENGPNYPGLLDEFRLSSKHRYVADFTPAARPFVTDASTIALYHFDKNLDDSSGNSFNLRPSFAEPEGLEYVRSTVHMPNYHPVVARANLPYGRVNAPYSARIVSNDIDLGTKLTTTVNGLPANLTATCAQGKNAAGTAEQNVCTISGTPTQTGAFTIIAETKDDNNTSGLNMYKLYVMSAVSPTVPIATSTPATSGPNTAVTIISKISQGTDDMVQYYGSASKLDDNKIDLLPKRDGDWQSGQAGLRFTNINIPRGARIISAYITFSPYNTFPTDSSNFVFRSELSDNAATYTGTAYNLTQRPHSDQSIDVRWQPQSWTINQTTFTPNIGPLIQVVVNRTNWQTGNAIGMMVIGDGPRSVFSFEGDPAKAPVLTVTYSK